MSNDENLKISEEAPKSPNINGNAETSETPATQYWIYRNITVFLASVVFAIILFQTTFFQDYFEVFGKLEYIGAFIVGIFFPNSFSAIPATAALLLLSEKLNFAVVAVCAGIGSTIGDYLIFRFLRDGLASDIKHLFSGYGGSRIVRILHSRYFGFMTPLLGALIIASPLPDEVGVGLLGVSNMSNNRFLALSFFLNTAGLMVLLGIFS